MADADVAITAGAGTKIDTRTVGAGTDEHRQVIVIGDPGTAAGVAPVDATAGLKVDSELPAAAALSDTTANPTTAMTGAAGMVWDEVNSQWVRARTAGSAGQTIGGGAPVVVPHHWHGTGAFYPAVAASNANAGDATTGEYHAVTGLMAYNGATFDRVRGNAANGLDVDVTRIPTVATATLANVASSATSVTVDAANAARLGMMIHNDSTAILYLKYGATASVTSYTVRLDPGVQWEMPEPVYTGIVDGIWSAANGNARVTELTA